MDENNKKSFVSIIILNWNGEEYIERCLKSVIKQTYNNYEIIVVDNASVDRSLSIIEKTFPNVTILKNGRNVGFSAGNNIGIQKTRGKYIATLNVDTEVRPEWLEALVKSIEKDSSVGMCASRMILDDNRDIIDSTGLHLFVNGTVIDRGREKPVIGNYEFVDEVFGPCAGAALYSKKMLNIIGLFDESFFAYYEDVDLAWRARLMGWKCIYVPDAIVYHKRSFSLKNRESQKRTIYLKERNKWFCIVKNWPRFILIKYSIFVFFHSFLSLIFHALFYRTLVQLKAWCFIIFNLPALLKKRKGIQQKKSVEPKAFSDFFKWPSLKKLTKYRAS
jgi:GT2 family glycosyltransferase